METITKNIPALALRGLTVFPRMTASFDVEREISVRALERAMETGQEIFHFGPVYGTNNIGEFLAIVHALALLKREGATRTVYSDSRNALLWVKGGKCKTRLPHTPRTAALYDLISRAERWLADNDWSDIPLHKWETGRWGEVPADFGRK